jgi:hypothetical protein
LEKEGEEKRERNGVRGDEVGKRTERGRVEDKVGGRGSTRGRLFKGKGEERWEVRGTW